jgi:very-short-patch-repair endonuclease
MDKTKDNYILTSLRKIRNKEWEFFIVSRIIHGLDDDEIEFVTQQLVRRPNKSWALMDLYFPQFGLHIEIDEPKHLTQQEADAKRERDIVQITGSKTVHIEIAGSENTRKSIATIRAEVDALIEDIKKRKELAIQDNSFEPWDFERQYSAAPVIERGVVSIEDNVRFHLQEEALRCFGYQKGRLQRGAWVIPDGSNDVVWFPRLFEYNIWKNELINDGETILERANDNDDTLYRSGLASIAQQIGHGRKYPGRKHIVFAKAKDAMGFQLLRYVGTFEMNLNASTLDTLQFDRVSTEEAIRPPLDV